MVGAMLAMAVVAVLLLASGLLPGNAATLAEAGPADGLRGAHNPPPHRSLPAPGTSADPGITNTSGLGGNGGGNGGSSSGPSGSSPGNLSGGGPGGPTIGNASRGAGAYPGVNGTFEIGSPVANLTPAFFQLVLQTPNLTKPWLWASLNATPFHYYEFGNAAEVTDQVNDTTYADNGTVLPPSQSNDSNFVAFCRAVSCHAIMAVPTEIDSPSAAVATVRYVEQTLHFTPEYWMLGGEPQGWTHYGIPWTSWSDSDASTPTPLEYAQEVQRYVSALRAADPGVRLIGIESADGGKWFDSAWLDEVALVDGRNLTALAIHPYPDGIGSSSANLSSFYQSVANPLNFPNNYPGLQSHVNAACGCTLPLWVGEYNAALEGNYSSYLTTYPEVAYMGAGILGAIKAGVPQLDFFSYSHLSESLVNATGTPLPIYTLFATFFENLTLGVVDGSSVAGGPGNVFAMTVTNGSHTSMLVVSTNLTETLNLTLSLPGGPYLGGTNVGWHAWWWSPEALAPSLAHGTTFLPTTWTVPPQGILLVNVD